MLYDELEMPYDELGVMYFTMSWECCMNLELGMLYDELEMLYDELGVV